MISDLFSHLRFQVLTTLDIYKGRNGYRYTYFDNGVGTKVELASDAGKRRRFTLRSGTSDLDVLSSIFQQHSYAISWMARHSEIVNWYEKIVAAGKTPLIIDAGANIGMASLYYADLFPQAAIIALEPEPNNFKELKRHTATEHMILPVEMAIGADPGKVVIVDNGLDAWGMQVELAKAGQSGISIASISDCLSMAQKKWDVVPFIAKVDIEGYESNLFSHSVDWIDSFALLVVEIHDWMLPKQKSSQPLIQALATRDRDFLIRGENIFSVSNDIYGASNFSDHA